MNKYDVVIIGGGTAGVSCAWNCGKKGLKTLLIEQNSFLGGSITSSLVIPAMKTSDKSINNDFFNEFYNNLKTENGAITYSDGNKGWFNPHLSKIILDKMMVDSKVDVLFECRPVDIKTINKKILSISIETLNGNNNSCFYNKLLSSPIETRFLVDATGDAKICEKLNCEFLENSENLTQPKSLRFILSGVNIKKFTDWIMSFDTNREVTTSALVDGETHVSTAYTWDTASKWALEPIFEQAIKDKVLTKEDTNYFQLFSVAGTPDSIAFNAPRLISEGDNPYIEGRLAILRLSKFCKKYLPGFENSHISSIANSMGIRVSKRIKGQYVYTYEDLITSKKFAHPAVISDYPVDVHSSKKDSSTLEKVYKEYQLPIESLMVDDYENLFVIGRCISAEFKAQAALRIIPSCFSMGEAVAKYISLNH